MPPPPVDKKGFTLAEVLITLAIIGVVAALTIPAVVRNYQKTQTVTQLKKAYSEMNQAFQLSQAEHGFTDTWDFTNYASQLDKTKTFVDEYFFPYLKITETCIPTSDKCWSPTKKLNGIDDTNTNDLKKTVSLITANGYSIAIWITADGTVASFYIDVNGPKKGPSVLGRDVFYCRFTFKKTDTLKQGFHFYGADIIPDLGRQELKEGSRHTCNKSDEGIYCSALIQKDGWHIADDYPWN